MEENDPDSKSEWSDFDKISLEGIRLVGKNGRKIITEKLIKMENNFYKKASSGHQACEAKITLAQMFSKIDEALDKEYNSLLKDWEKQVHSNRFLFPDSEK